MTGAPIRDGAAMVRAMQPVLRAGRYVFVTAADGIAAACAPAAVAMFVEDEGRSFILPERRAAELGFPPGPVMRWITLTVHSALDGVGLTAAVAGALAAERIACNMVAAAHHDHVFVPAERAEEALRLLVKLQHAG